MKIVTIMGGTGSYVILPELKKYNVDITAIIGGFDSGGSTGRIRREFGGIALGDLRRGFLGLGSDEDAYGLLKEATKHRFNTGFMEGQCLGNFILLSQEIGKGIENIRKAEKLFGFKPNHHIMPPSFDDCQLCAELENGEIIEGETNIDVPKHDSKIKIKRVFLRPEAFSYDECIREIENADKIVIGPGDLYSSILQSILVKGIKEALKRSNAKKIFICNIFTKAGETHDFNVSDHIRELVKYMGVKPDYVIINSKTDLKLEGVKDCYLSFVEADAEELEKIGVKPVLADTVNYKELKKHDPQKLAKVIMELG